MEKTNIKKDGRNFALMVLAFFGVMCSVNAVFVYFALHSYSGTVVDKPYEKGLDYNKVIADAKEQEQMGVTATGSYAAGKFSLLLVEDLEKPVTGAHVAAHFKRAVKDGDDFTQTLEDVGNGRYESSVHMPYSGLWIVRTEAKWDSKTYSASHKIIAP